MKSPRTQNSSSVFNFLTLLSFVFGLLLIMFLKQGEGKNTEQQQKSGEKQEGRVQKPNKVETKTFEQLDLNQRQLKIIEVLKQEGRMEPSQIYDLVPGVSTRTVRRDMDALVGAGLVSQKGATKSTIYKYKG